MRFSPFTFRFGCLRCHTAVLCILIFLVSGFLTGAAAGAETAAPPIRSAAEIDYPPFSIVDEEGRASGFSVELLRGALSAMGRSVTFRTGPWAEVRGWLEKGEIDALPLVGRTPEREPLFDFTFPYMTLHGAIVVQKTTSDIWDLEDLSGRTVAVMKGDNAEEFLRREDRGIDIRTTATFEEALRELSKGRHDAVFIQRLVALRLIQESGLTNLKVVNSPVDEFRQDFCFAVKEGDRDTLALLNEGLSIVMADGTYRHLHAKWFASLELPTHRRIVVGGDHNFPPFEYLDENGRPAGYNVDLTRAIAQEVGLDVEIRLGPWAEIREALARGEIDVIQGMFYSPERDLTFDFSPSHAVNHSVAVVRKEDGPPPTTVEALAQKRIVVQQGDIMHDFVRKKGLKQIAAADAQESALRELAEGKYDLALVSRLTALYWIKRYGWENLVVGKKPFVSPEYCYAAPNNQKALLAQFSEGLSILESTGEYRRIQEKWFGVYKELPLTLAEIMRRAAFILGPLLLLLAGFFLWNWALRRQVAARTEALQKSEEFQRAMVDCSPVAIYSVDFGGRVMAWNSSAERIFGWREEEVAGKPLPIVPEERRGEFDTIRKQIMAGKIFVGREVVRKKKDGTLFHGSLSAAPIRDAAGRMTGIIAAMEDITERKASEMRIHHLNNVLRAIREVNQLIVRERDPERLIEEGCRLLVKNRGYPSALIVMTDAENRPVSWSMAGLATASEELSAKLKNGNLPACFERVRTERGVLLVEDRETVCGNCPLARKIADSQSLCVALAHGDAVFGYLAAAVENDIAVDDEERDLLVEMAEDIAYALRMLKMEEDRRRGEKDLRESELRFQQFAELAPVGIVISDREENIIYASPKFFDLFGYSLEEVPSVEQWWKLAYPDEAMQEAIKHQWAAVMEESRKRRTEIRPVEYPVICKDGSVRQIEFRMAASEALNFVIFTDVTERKKAEAEHEKLQDQLLQAQKMESVGRLAGGVAHDYNNMLGVILGYAEMALESVDPEDPLHADLSEILAAARRSSDITRQLLAFASKQTIDPKVLDLNETVEDMLKMLRRLIGENIDLSWQPGGGLWPVRMDPSQLDQILANLCVNAGDAIAEVGNITIETENVAIDEEYCADHAGFVPGEFVVLAVSDDGAGMDKEVLENLFEPFFTTKKSGKGTGLGLATVYGIVKQNSGFINVYSEPGEGTTFRIYLPRHTGGCEEENKQAMQEVLSGSGETILVVEDERSILRIGKKMLESLGYSVLAASSAEEAAALAKEHTGKIHLLITDVVMPAMNGRELAERLQALYPDLKVLYMSGYTANVIAHRGVLEDGVFFMQKPFSKQKLAAKVREALAG